jgi:hypothetical protein
VSAPPGQVFIVIECAITNRTPTAQVFEPPRIPGRQTELFLYTGAGDRESPHGPGLAEYSAQNVPASGLIPLSPIGERIEAPRPVGLPLGGALVFSYPLADLRAAQFMLLFVHEFGQGPGAGRSVGVFRLPVDHHATRAVYEAAGI